MKAKRITIVRKKVNLRSRVRKKRVQLGQCRDRKKIVSPLPTTLSRKRL